MEATCSSETYLHFQRTKRRCIPEDITLLNRHPFSHPTIRQDTESGRRFLLGWREVDSVATVRPLTDHCTSLDVE
jgi:hypothetical protein